MNDMPSQAQSFRTEIAVLQKAVNKYSPGSAPFSIPALSLESGTTISRKSVKTDNKNSVTAKTTVTTSNCINLEIPKEYTRYFSHPIINVGTRFIIGFIGGDITTAKIIGCFDRD